jgi:hypothetical protein
LRTRVASQTLQALSRPKLTPNNCADGCAPDRSGASLSAGSTVRVEVEFEARQVDLAIEPSGVQRVDGRANSLIP